MNVSDWKVFLENIVKFLLFLVIFKHYFFINFMSSKSNSLIFLDNQINISFNIANYLMRQISIING